MMRVAILLVLVIAPTVQAGFSLDPQDPGTMGLAVWNDFSNHRVSHAGDVLLVNFTFASSDDFNFTWGLRDVAGPHENPLALFEYVMLEVDGQKETLSPAHPVGSLVMHANATHDLHVHAIVQLAATIDWPHVRAVAATNRQARGEDLGPDQVDAWLAIMQAAPKQTGTGPQLQVNQILSLRLTLNLASPEDRSVPSTPTPEGPQADVMAWIVGVIAAPGAVLAFRMHRRRK